MGAIRMTSELVVILAVVAVLLIYVIRHLPKAIRDLKKELGE